MLRISPAELDALAEFDGWGDDTPLPIENEQPMPFDDFDPWEVA